MAQKQQQKPTLASRTPTPMPKQQQQQRPGGGAGSVNGGGGAKKTGSTQSKKTKGFGCCVKKNKNAPKKAAPPKNNGGSKRSLSSLFRRRNKGNASNISGRSGKRPPGKAITPSKGGRGGIRPIGQQPHLRPTKLPSQPKLTPQPSIGGPRKSGDKSKKQPSKIEVKKVQKPSGDKTDNLKTCPLDTSMKVMKKKKTTKTEGSKRDGRRSGKDQAYDTCRNFQEVKVCVANFENGMTERKVILTSLYPTDQPPKPYVLFNSGINTDLPMISPSHSAQRKQSYTSLQRANSHERVPNLPGSSERLLLASPEKPPAPAVPRSPHKPLSNQSSQQSLVTPSPSKGYPSYRDRALSTIYQLRGHYQLTSDEIRLLSKNPELKVITMRADLALQDAQRNLRNLKILAGTHLLPDLNLFSDELSALILELDRFIDAIHTVSEHAEASPTKKHH